MRLPRLRPRGIRTAKTVGAAVAAYAVATYVSSNPRPILAPLTALLVVQLTLYDTIRTGLSRIGSVVVGVLAAVLFASYVQFEWWWLGVLILVAMLVGRLLRLGGQLMEAPISAMLIFAVSGSQSAAVGRVYETLVGAGVGVVVHALIAPPLYVRPASAALQHLATRMSEVLRRIAEDMGEEYTPEETAGWLTAAREVGRDIANAERALDRAEQSLRLNPRARLDPVEHYDTRLTGPSLRSGLGALEHAGVSLRGLCRALADRARGPAENESVYGGDVRATLSGLFGHLADAVTAYGRLVGAEVTGPRGDLADEVRAALTAAWSERAQLTDLLREQERARSGAWELHGALLANVDRLLREIDVEAREQAREAWRRDAAERRRRTQALRDRVRAGAVEPITRRRHTP